MVAHFEKGGPQYSNALSCLGGLPGPLLLMLTSDLRTALSCELEDHAEVREATRGQLLTAPGWHSSTRVLLVATGGMPSYLSSGGTTFMCQTPLSTAPKTGTTSSRPSTTTGCTPPTRGRRSGRRRSAKTIGAAFAPACWSFGTPYAGAGTTSGSANSAPGT